MVRLADRLPVAHTAGDQTAEQGRRAGVAGSLAGVAFRAVLLDRLLGALEEVGTNQWRVRLGARPSPLARVVSAMPVLVAERDVPGVEENALAEGLECCRH